VNVERSVIIGLYCAIFGLYWRIKLKRADRLKGLILYAINVNFILCTAFFIFAIIQTQFDITVSYIYSMSGVQLIFEFSGSGAGHSFIGFRFELDDYCI